MRAIGVMVAATTVVAGCMAASSSALPVCPPGTAGSSDYCQVSRLAPTSFSAHTVPRHDRRAPFRFTTSGRLGVPRDVGIAKGCRGHVAVYFKVRQHTISARRATLRRRGGRCVFSSRVTLHRARIAGLVRSFPATLRVFLRFQGNAYLRPKSHRVYTVRAG